MGGVMSLNDPFEQKPVYQHPKRIRTGVSTGRWIFNPRWDKKAKHMRGEIRQGRL